MIRRIAGFYKRILRETPQYTLLTIGALCLSNLLDSVAIVSIAPAIDLMMSKRGGAPLTALSLKFQSAFHAAGLPFGLRSLLCALAVFTLLKSFFIVAVAALNIRARIFFEEKLKKRSFWSIISADWRFFAREKSGEIINVLTTESAKAASAFGEACRLAGFTWKVVFGVGVLVFLAWRLALLAVLTLAPLALVTRAMSRAAYKHGMRSTEIYFRLFGAVAEYLGLIKVIKGYAAEEQIRRLFNQWVDKYKQTVFWCDFLPQLVNSVGEPLGFFAVVLISYLGLYHVGVPLAVMPVFLLTLYRVIPVTSQINTALAGLYNNLPGLEHVDLYVARATADASQNRGDAEPQFSRELRIEGGSFSYDGRQPVLQEVDIEIPFGTTAALTGSSGAGKSTLIDVVMGFNSLTAGRLLIDGADLRGLSLAAWRRMIGYVPQDSILFNDTLFNNVAWGKDGASESDVREACRMAHVEDFVSRLPDGYDTVVGERGAMLSGGQRQRVALARALVRKPRLLILDEATSALDTESERVIRAVIDSLKGRMTVILIAHRFSTIQNCDMIYVLQKGRVAQKGRYAGLMAEDGLFRELAQVGHA